MIGHHGYPLGYLHHFPYARYAQCPRCVERPDLPAENGATFENSGQQPREPDVDAVAGLSIHFVGNVELWRRVAD
ncbi:hypothetical protein D3C87_1733510 [compost metagenome]